VSKIGSFEHGRILVMGLGS